MVARRRHDFLRGHVRFLQHRASRRIDAATHHTVASHAGPQGARITRRVLAAAEWVEQEAQPRRGQVEEVGDAVARLQEDLHERPCGLTINVTDPDGVWIELYQVGVAV